jgi:TolB-like protein/Flp pilus assembly protein TadD
VARLKRLVVALAGVGAVVGGLMGFWAVYKEFFRAQAGPAPAARPAREIKPLSLIVVPFTGSRAAGADAGTAANDGDFADGLTVALTSDIGRIAKLLVIAPPTAMTFKGKSVSAHQVGSEVGVRYVLTGQIQWVGDGLRVTVQLADALNDAQLWSDNFVGPLGNLGAVQRQVTGRIANALGRELVAASARDLRSRPMSDAGMDLYLRALASVYKPQSIAGLQSQEALFRKVLAADPENVEALAQLARALVQLGFNFNRDLGAEAAARYMTEGRDLGLKVRALDPGHPGGWIAIGVHALWARDAPMAVQAFSEALALDPHSVLANIALAGSLVAAGRPQEAVEPASQALLLDPRGPQVSAAMTNMGRAYLYSDQPDKAVDWLNRARLSNPAFWALDADLAVAYARMGDLARSRAAAAKLLQSHPDFRLSTSSLAPGPTSPEAYKKLYSTLYLPSSRQAGLPP